VGLEHAAEALLLPDNSPQAVYEVTAVDTGAGTCTVKACYNHTGTLVSTTEQAGIYYDSDNEPSVGDVGLVMRTANNALFLVTGRATPPVYLECRTSDPGSPTNGEMWLRTDLL